MLPHSQDRYSEGEEATRRRRRLLATGAVLVTALLVGACGGGTDEDETTSAPATSRALIDALPALSGGPQVASTYVAAIPGTDAFVALVRDGDEVVAYLCDGKGLGEWVRGSANGPRIQLDGEGGVRLTGTEATGRIDGTVTVSGQERAFAASQASGDDGLFRQKFEKDGRQYVVGSIEIGDIIKGAATDGQSKGGFETKTDPNSQGTTSESGGGAVVSTTTTTIAPLPRQTSGQSHDGYCRNLNAYAQAILNGMKAAKSEEIRALYNAAFADVSEALIRANC